MKNYSGRHREVVLVVLISFAALSSSGNLQNLRNSRRKMAQSFQSLNPDAAEKISGLLRQSFRSMELPGLLFPALLLQFGRAHHLLAVPMLRQYHVVRVLLYLRTRWPQTSILLAHHVRLCALQLHVAFRVPQSGWLPSKLGSENPREDAVLLLSSLVVTHHRQLEIL
jgi:hypothetical protein